MTKRCPYCQKEISEHEAGRCLDALIYQRLNPELKVEWRSRGFPVPDVHDIYIDGFWEDALVPHYSEDLNHAIELWNKKYSLIEEADGQWDVYDKNTGEFIATANTPALAICRAYLIEKMNDR